MDEELSKQAPKEIFPSIVNSNNNNLEPNTCYIGTWEEADPYLQDNCYIKKGYRINFNTVKRALRSLFMCHNESTNIWSHLLAALLFASLIVYIFFYLAPGHVLEGDKLNVVSGSINGSSIIINETNYDGTVIIYTKDNMNVGYIDKIMEKLSNYVISLK